MAKKKDTKPQKAGLEHTTRRLRVRLTPEERNGKSTALVHLMDESDRIDLELEEIKKQFRERKRRIQERRDQIRRDIDDCSEARSVRCTVERDYHRGLVVTRRTDTGDVVDEREMTDADRQLRLGNTEENDGESQEEGHGAEGNGEEEAKPEAGRQEDNQAAHA